jgi:hypothetical protein
MKTKNGLASPGNWKLFLVLPVITIAIVTFTSCAAHKKVTTSQTGTVPSPTGQSSDLLKRDAVEDTETVPYVVVEEMPEFLGGDSLLLDYIVHNTKYPEIAKMKKIQGRVIIRFCVTETGTVNAEAVRVTGTLPLFKPGKQGGKNVPVWYMVPITFTLK